MVRNPPPGPEGQEISMVGVDCSIIMNPKVWEASGHVGGFSDPMAECKKCNRRFRADKVYRSAVADMSNPDALAIYPGTPENGFTVEANDPSEADVASRTLAE